MKKAKYIYSKETQRFEPLKTPLRTKVLRALAMLSAIIVTSSIIVALAFNYLGSPEERRMRQELSFLQEKYDLLQKDLGRSKKRLSELEQRDNDIYRVIFEAEPLSKQVRNGLAGIDEHETEIRLSPYNNVELIDALEKKTAVVAKRIKTQNKSYDSLLQLINAKKEMLASIPSIQPVANNELKRIASGFGYRIDPIYKIGKFHAGLDFTAPQGTPIYASGNGKVEQAQYSTGGYGNEIWINHGYGYRSHYAHMVKLKSRVGQLVKRGEVIGWVGNTGKSTGPHLHYEVERKGVKIDPVHFFFNDLAAKDFDRLVKLSQASNQSFD